MLWICGLRKRKEGLNTRKGIGVGPVLNLQMPKVQMMKMTGELVFDLKAWFQSDVYESDLENFNLDDWNSDPNDIPLPET